MRSGRLTLTSKPEEGVRREGMEDGDESGDLTGGQPNKAILTMMDNYDGNTFMDTVSEPRPGTPLFVKHPVSTTDSNFKRMNGVLKVS